MCHVFNICFFYLAIKYNFKYEKSPGLEIKPFDIFHSSDATIIINNSDDSEEGNLLYCKYLLNEFYSILFYFIFQSLK